MLELNDGDQIDSNMLQTGGTEEETITIKVRDQTGEEMMFKVKKETKMSKIFTAYAQRKGVDLTALKFILDGQRVTEQDTPKMLEMEEGDQIDAVMEQLGGADGYC